MLIQPGTAFFLLLIGLLGWVAFGVWIVALIYIFKIIKSKNNNKIIRSPKFISFYALPLVFILDQVFHTFYYSLVPSSTSPVGNIMFIFMLLVFPILVIISSAFVIKDCLILQREK